MKLTITSLIAVAAALIMAAPLKAQSLQEVKAEGNNVYVEIVDEFAGRLPQGRMGRCDQLLCRD